MENKQGFTYRYSATQNREVESIRKKYLPREENKMDVLRRLDLRVRMAGMIPGLTLGVIGCLIFGIGMCFGLDVFAGADWLTVAFMALGVLVMLPAYSVYSRIAEKTKNELTPEILKLSEEIIKDEKN